MEKEQIGRYKIIRRIGAGGMGEVFEAFDPNLERTVALKTILPSVSSNPDAYKRFIREAKSNANLRHPSIVTVYDFGRIDNVCFLVMDFIEGMSLDKLAKQQTFSYDYICKTMLYILDGLQYAHNNNIIHRDIKPANILISKQGKAFITDFGLAKAIQSDSAAISVEGMIVGTPSYMAPEQADGINVDGQADVFSAGVMFYELLSRQLPFAAQTPLKVLYKLVNEEPPRLRTINADIPIALENICHKAIEKDKAKRYKTPKDMFMDIRLYLKNPNMKSSISTEKPLSANVAHGDSPTLIGDSPNSINSEELPTLIQNKPQKHLRTNTVKSQGDPFADTKIGKPRGEQTTLIMPQKVQKTKLSKNQKMIFAGVVVLCLLIYLCLPVSIETLKRHLETGNKYERINALRTLGKLPQKKSIPILIRALDNDERNVREEAKSLLADKDGSILPIIVNLLKKYDKQYENGNAYMIDFYIENSTDKYLPLVLKMLNNASELFKKHVYTRLQKRKRKNAEELFLMAQNAKSIERLKIIEILHGIHAKQTLKKLLDTTLKSKILRQKALKLLFVLDQNIKKQYGKVGYDWVPVRELRQRGYIFLDNKWQHFSKLMKLLNDKYTKREKITDLFKLYDIYSDMLKTSKKYGAYVPDTKKLLLINYQNKIKDDILVYLRKVPLRQIAVSSKIDILKALMTKDILWISSSSKDEIARAIEAYKNSIHTYKKARNVQTFEDRWTHFIQEELSQYLKKRDFDTINTKLAVYRKTIRKNKKYMKEYKLIVRFIERLDTFYGKIYSSFKVLKNRFITIKTTRKNVRGIIKRVGKKELWIRYRNEDVTLNYRDLDISYFFNPLIMKNIPQKYLRLLIKFMVLEGDFEKAKKYTKRYIQRYKKETLSWIKKRVNRKIESLKGKPDYVVLKMQQYLRNNSRSSFERYYFTKQLRLRETHKNSKHKKINRKYFDFLNGTKVRFRKAERKIKKNIHYIIGIFECIRPFIQVKITFILQEESWKIHNISVQDPKGDKDRARRERERMERAKRIEEKKQKEKEQKEKERKEREKKYPPHPPHPPHPPKKHPR